MPTKCYPLLRFCTFFVIFYDFLLAIIPFPVRKVAQKNRLNSSGSYILFRSFAEISQFGPTGQSEAHQVSHRCPEMSLIFVSL